METENNKHITFFGKTTFRGAQKKFGIRDDDKRRHIYIIGKTGMGKTELLKNMIVQDIRRGNGVGFIDPHGEAAEEILDYIPEERIKDVVYFNPSDLDNPIAFNIMEDVDPNYRHLVAGGLMAVFKKIWPDVWSSRMEYILNNTILALLEIPGSTLLGINRLMSDPEWRAEIVNKLQDPVVKAFWTKEFARYTQRYEVEATAAIQNKIGQFISVPLIRNIIGQEHSTINMRKIMDEKKIFIMNLSKGRIGEESSRLLGALLITKLQLAAMSRVDIPEKERADFILYIDEFQNFSTESFATILSEARKYRLSLVLAHQYITQMDETVRDAVFGNVGTMIVFRVGADDGEFLEREFSPEFFMQDLVNLPKQNIYVKLAIDGVTSRPFSADTLPPVQMIGSSLRDEIIKQSNLTYGTVKKIVEEKIAENTEGGNADAVMPVRQKEIELYDAECANCQKKMKVPFKPDPNRPVYCKTCLNKRNMEKEASVAKPIEKTTERSVEKPKEKLIKSQEFISLEKSSKDFVPIEKKKRTEIKKEETKEVKLKKEVDFIGLKDILKEVKQQADEKKTEGVEKNKSNETDKKSGEITPGQTIKF
ncbi:MAG: CxxC-x17-CxxC domain-containing protein [Candidatus Paceibacterota bacterium]|jgi:CxxC-x17-CxxC domain-containing protein